MTKPLLAFAIAAVSVACLAIQPNGARAGGPCADSCNLADHMASHQMVAMNDMPGMGGMSAPSPAPGGPKPSTATSNDLHQTAHMAMTMPRPATPADQQRADRILAALRTAIEPFKDYRAAEAAGYKQFQPKIPQEIYHFTNWSNAFLNVFSFDPARPTSLMYMRVPGGYELVGAMYTAAEQATQDQLDERVPLSIATWHLHTNLCLPPPGRQVKWVGPGAQFGLAGSITTAQACEAAGGSFKPVIYNWMVHVWPFETDPSKIWATEEHPGIMDHM